MIGREIGDKLIAEQIICECRRLKGPVLVHKGANRAQRYVLYGLPAQAIISKKWRLTEPKRETRNWSQTYRENNDASKSQGAA